MKIQMVTFRDLKGVCELDASIDSSLMKVKIQRREILVAKEESEIVGILRFSLFWDNVPFINMLIVKECKRNIGIGTNLMQKWESMMNDKGYGRVMTSTQSDETARDFYKKLQYQEIGGFDYPGQERELLFLKELAPEGQGR